MSPEQEKVCDELAVIREFVCKLNTITEMSHDKNEYAELKAVVKAFLGVDSYVLGMIRESQKAEDDEIKAIMNGTWKPVEK